MVVLPLIIVTLTLAEIASYFNAKNGITRIAQQFFGFKASELKKYTENQWELLTENNFQSRPLMVQAAKEAVASYAQSIILSDSEIIFAINDSGTIEMSTSPLFLSEDEKAKLMPMLENEALVTAEIGGTQRVFLCFYFFPFGWNILLTEERSVFFADADRIASQTILTLSLSLAAASVLLVFFSGHLTNPLGRVIAAMNGIIRGGDLKSRVPVEYSDETGHLALTFNTMLGELEIAYERIKGQAFEAALAQKKEERIRNIFQKYVPQDLIEKFFASPESMLVGDNRELAILFSDIRSFTTISESLAPDELVKSLNLYFSGQVDIIMNREGIVDKYIGDAIMAFWGAPVKHENDPFSAVLAGLDMLDAVAAFNVKQREIGKTEFQIGIGINYGIVTVGNIGSERKMDYTVIGDMVNLASRMEGLTKQYHADILISESVYAELEKCGSLSLEMSQSNVRIPFRLLDTVAVKGKTKGVKIYTVKRSLDETEKKAWAIHNEGMELYYSRDFTLASSKFDEVLSLLPDDFNAANLLERCRSYANDPPPENWDGVEIMKSK